ncbi:hypothetical protein Mtc_0646 [Methanocella conradii HZ254]|uniref:Uncharacterized protein n=1 Tax=Methanocella conradii (strain DSM 24694 / JCM 17849 / CGMCC 1.5162 / HZ254) TaxID=1041930 RepID=H8I6T9_METCZ|nr:hypothetical protein [Methanocella conradii]AFC99409.1 hypothetical protein Mtc_0646 [Methanocella conradii HZ254]
MRLNLIVIISGLIIIIICTYIILNNNYKINNNLNNSSVDLNLTTNLTQIDTIEPNNSFTIPPNDYVINHINWSSYPNLQTGYVYTACISEPTDVIPYKFLEVEIVTEVKNTENKTIIKEQLAGVAKEAKKIYGPGSSIDIIGTKDGIARWFASILPYEDKIR